MTNRLSSTSAGLTRRAIYISLIAAIANLIAAFEYFYLASEENAWQLYVLAGNTLALALIGFVSGFLTRRGRLETGIWLLCLAGGVAFGVAPFLVSGMGVVYGGGIALLIVMIAWQTMPIRAARQLTIWGLGAGMVGVGADLVDLPNRIPAPALVISGITVLVVGATIAFGFYNLRQFQNYNLRSKLIISFVGVVVLAVTIVAFVTNRYIKAQITQQLGSSISVLAGSQGSEVGDYILGNYHYLETLALNLAIHDSLSDFSQAPPLDFNIIQQLDQQWRTADAANDDTDPLVVQVIVNPLADELRKFRQTFPAHAEVFLTDLQGVIIASTNRTSDYYQADEDWWQAVYENGRGKPYIGQPDFDASSQLYAINIAVPVFTDDKFVGILRTTLDISALVNLLDAAKFGKTGVAELWLPDNRLLSKVRGGFLPLSDEDVVRLNAIQNSFGSFFFEGGTSLVSQSLITSHNVEDVAFIEALGWHVIVHEDLTEALAPLTTITRATILISILVMAGAALAGYQMAQFLSAPIVQLTSVADEVRAGNLNIEAPVRTGDEVGTLAATFNNMTAQIRTLVDTLEQRVADRTRALATSTEVSRRLSTILDQSQLVKEVVEEIQHAFNYYHAHIYLWDAKRENLVMVGGTGEAGRLMLASGHLIPAERGLVGRAAETGTVVLVPDVSQTIGWLPNPLLPDTKAEIAVPILLGDTVLGVLDVQQNRVGGLDQNDADLLLSIVNQVAIALQNAQAYAAAQKQVIKEAQRSEIIQKIQGSTSVEEALKISVRELGHVLGTVTKVKLGTSGDNGHKTFVLDEK
ncbi:MAG: GAF domain-containing protein [Anaerolineales bacterium]|nr:GAF domain-containing protein [Anaerolineales bacterium]